MASWDSDFDWDLDQWHQVVSEQFTAFAKIEPLLLGFGWDNICLGYTCGTVFRLPRREVGGQLIEVECRVLPCLSGHLPLPIPEIQYFGKPSEMYPYPFMGYGLMSGATSDKLKWSSKERKAVAYQLGEFLRCLHSIVPTPEMQLPIVSFSKAGWQERISYRSTNLSEIDPTRKEWSNHLLALANRLLAESDGEHEKRLCHGDLYPRHLLASDDHQLTGVIDWGDVQLCDPANDLSIAFTFFDPEERSEFWHGYGQVPRSSVVARAQLKSILYALSLTAYGVDVGDDAMKNLGESIGERVLRERR